jgi:transcription elongation factor Elf1
MLTPFCGRPTSNTPGEDHGYTKWGSSHQVSHLALIHFPLHKTLFTMATQCPLCSKQLPSSTALRNHTGTKDAALRRKHACPKCEHKFCSQGAMEQHRDAPTHSAMFSCNVCKKSFGSKKAIGDHKKSSLHARMLARANSTVGVGASANSQNVSSSPGYVISGTIWTLTYIQGFIFPNRSLCASGELHFN